MMANKNTICLWYDGTASDAARFYAETFPDSTVGTVLRAPGDYPNGKQGDVLTVEAKRAFEAMMAMEKIDIAAIEAARRGG
jgi:predicted 3-demethylubiquinone-9 3-methyltransferase (glyoxalase superfamily)